ncbi:hypothetical protein E0H80_08320 [Acinetobacter sp. ANC 4779]|uniref:hypothetical protein n=1 Tax=Acinetobacter sp. ANC 4779 TaxID=2529848 RepID=UPI001040323F|nr:hypothetical protein [Acinetobacter sp. ANC 4779]TCB50302.1 hypothetical protein E0H80_08320 [Acinetobacter sp. ANC 4779]
MLFSNTFSHSLKNITFPFLKVLLSFVLYFNLITQANAGTVGGWSMGNPVAQGASTVYTGTKNIVLNGADYVKKGTAIIAPTATGVAKVLARGVAGVALSVAVEQLLGAVDWVLDPANNRIVYYENPVASPSSCNQILASSGMGPNWQTSLGVTSISCSAITYDKASNVSCSKITYTYKDKNTGKSITINSGNYCVSGQLVNEREEKYLPLPVVAQKVISNAESGDTRAQVATLAAAADIVAEAETDDAKARPIAQQLESSSKTQPADQAAADKANEATGTQTQNPTKPDTTDLKLEFPIFCNWAPIVCEAAQKVISFPITLTQWWETGKEKAEGWATSISQAWASTKEYFKEETKEKENTEVDIEDIPIPQKGVTVSIGDNTCPSMPVNIHTPFKTIQSDISPVYLCQIATGMKAFFIALGFFTASLIVGRRN